MKRLLVAAVVIAVASPAFAYRDQKLQKAVAKAAGQMQKGQPEEAVATLQKVVAKLDSGEAYLALGRIQQQAAMMDDAVASFAKARELEKSDVEVLTALAGITLSTGSAADALVPAEKAVAITASPETLATLARVRMRASALEKAKDGSGEGARGRSDLRHRPSRARGDRARDGTLGRGDRGLPQGARAGSEARRGARRSRGSARRRRPISRGARGGAPRGERGHDLGRGRRALGPADARRPRGRRDALERGGRDRRGWGTSAIHTARSCSI